MNDIDRLLLTVLTALACPLALPVLLDEKEDEHEAD